MPVENSAECQPNRRFLVSRSLYFLRRIKHHLDHAFNAAIGGSKSADADPETARDR